MYTVKKKKSLVSHQEFSWLQFRTESHQDQVYLGMYNDVTSASQARNIVYFNKASISARLKNVESDT